MTLIDLLNVGRECNLNCRNCSQKTQAILESSLEEDVELIRKIDCQEGRRLHLYPKEITQNLELLPLMRSYGQTYVLSNGLTMTDEKLDCIKELGFEKIKYTLYTNAQQQKFWTGTSVEQYENLTKTITSTIRKGLDVEVYAMLIPQTIQDLPDYYSFVGGLGVSRLTILRLIPTAQGRTLGEEFYVGRNELSRLLEITDSLKKGKEPYIGFGASFGPDFTRRKARSSLSLETRFCPSIDGRYVGVSMKTRLLSWCFYMQTEDAGIIGTIHENGTLDITDAPDFSSETLRKKLTGICASDACDYQEVCLGGCRSAAYIFSRQRGKPDMYAGMDICRTNARLRT